MICWWSTGPSQSVGLLGRVWRPVSPPHVSLARWMSPSACALGASDRQIFHSCHGPAFAPIARLLCLLTPPFPESCVPNTEPLARTVACSPLHPVTMGGESQQSARCRRSVGSDPTSSLAASSSRVRAAPPGPRQACLRHARLLAPGWGALLVISSLILGAQGVVQPQVWSVSSAEIQSFHLEGGTAGGTRLWIRVRLPARGL